ncbi:DUF3099 domain-containing protein [Kocuria palustris]|uniref:DUF3099 domain-containing protein n=1 Tax=Kocuria palustris TaxID=71999 RepID=UPI002042C857|nr:DUF3099 domain-containing protein [Kocuria palustris]MCM3331830.1 DUF3099 domain-containing protein [Kocuria palustris]
MTPRYLNPSDLAAMQASAERARARSRAVEPRASSSSGSGGKRRGKDADSYSITSTPEAHSADMGRRMVVYGIQMLLRVVCLIAFVLVDHWILRIVCGLGIIVLPWSAVLLANVGADRTERSSSYIAPEPEPSPVQLTAEPVSESQEETIDGEWSLDTGRMLESGRGRSGDGMQDNGPGGRGG